MVLLVGGEDDIVAHLAACYGGVVAHHGIVQAHAEFEMDVFAQHKAHGYAAILASATVAHHTVGQHDAVLNARGGCLVRHHGYVVQGAGVFDDAVAADVSVAALF